MLPDQVKKQWKPLVNQVRVIGFNSGRYDIYMVKKYFVKEITYKKQGECNEEVFAVKKQSDYMFLMTPKFKFLDVKNYIGTGLSCDAYCKSMSSLYSVDCKS